MRASGQNQSGGSGHGPDSLPDKQSQAGASQPWLLTQKQRLRPQQQRLLRQQPRLFLLLSILLTGCASPVIRPGHHGVDGLDLSTPVAWSAQGKAGQRLWTRDGPLLNSLRIFTDIAPGELVFRGRLRGAKDEGTRFRAGLGAIEIEELIIEAMGAGGMHNVRSTELRPARFNGRAGLRSEIACDSASGLHYRALLLAEGEDGSLSFLLYLAPAEHYFEHELAAIETIFTSAAR